MAFESGAITQEEYGHLLKMLDDVDEPPSSGHARVSQNKLS
jgi:hypothetical protein